MHRLTLLMVVSFVAAEQTAKADEMAGRIKSVASKHVVVTDSQNRDKSFQLTPATKVILPHKLGTAKDLKVDYRVLVHYETQEGVAVAKEIEVEGIKLNVVRIDPKANRIILRDKTGKDVSVPLQPGAMVKIDGAEKRLADLRPGDKASIFYEEHEKEKVAVHIEAKAEKAMMHGVPEEQRITPVEDERFLRVKVFYGTDRNPVDASHPEKPRAKHGGLSNLFFWGLLTGLGLAALSWLTVLFFSWKVGTQGRTIGITIAAVFGVLMILNQRLSPDSAKLLRTGLWFGSDRDDLSFGVCEVTIPKSHKHAELESPHIIRLEFHEDPAKHVMLQKVESLAQDAFFAQLSDTVNASSKKDAFVFVHGFNVSFEDAARRTAQLAYDLKFEGAPVFFSWPSQGLFLEYTVDEANAEWTIPHLKAFLKSVATRSGAQIIHLIAHSMGNRALTRALQGLMAEEAKNPPRFSEVILAAPDIDADVFKTQIFPGISSAAQRLTLYASSRDRALQLSKQVHGYPRAGESGDDIVVMLKMDTIDVSNVDTSLIGHSYYGDNNSFLADAFYLIHGGLPPERRERLRSVPLGSLKYWMFAP